MWKNMWKDVEIVGFSSGYQDTAKLVQKHEKTSNEWQRLGTTNQAADEKIRMMFLFLSNSMQSTESLS